MIDIVITLQHICILKVAQSCPTLCDPMDYTLQGILQARILAEVAFPSPGIEPRSPTLQADSLPAEPQGKPKNTGVGSPSLLQQIFLSQELNQGLLHCRWILYQLSYQFSSVDLLSHVWLIATPWITARQASLSIINSRSLPKLMSIESVMPSSHLILSSPSSPVPSPSQHQGLFQWVNFSNEVAKVLEFQLQLQSFQWTPRTDLL